jgi:large repetitive protein
MNAVFTPGETVVYMQKSTILEGPMETQLIDILPQPASNLNPPSAFQGTVATEDSRRSDIRLHGKFSSTVEKFACLAAPRFVRSGVVTLISMLLMSVSAQAQSVFSVWQNVGTTSPAQSVTVTTTVSGTVSKVEVLSVGVSGTEFAKGGGSSTCESASLAAGGACTESVTFTPAYPGRRIGAVVLVAANGSVLGTGYVSGTGQGGLAVLTPGNTISVAGVYRSWTSTLDGVPATSANLDQPSSIALDGAGNMYIADSAHNKIRMVCFSSSSATISGTSCSGAGIITTIAGTGDAGYSGDGSVASASNVTLNGPSGVGLDGAGNLYIADTGNNVVREISAITGLINTVAGNGAAGFQGDSQLASASTVELNSPQGVTADAAGNLYIADTSNQRIRRVDAVTGIITTAVGNGDPSGLGDGKGTYSGDLGPAIDAGLSLPYAVAFDIYGNMLIPDSANHRIRAVAAVNGVLTPNSIISTLAGTGTPGSGCQNGQTDQQALNTPSGIAVDAASNLYISDTQNSCIRKVNSTTNTMTTIAVNNASAISLNGTLDAAQVYAPIGIVVDGSGNVYYADRFFMLVDEIQSTTAVLNYTLSPVRQGDQSAPQIQTVENDGNATLSIELTSITPDINSAVDAETTTCSPIPYAVTEDGDCVVGGVFAPSTTLNPSNLPNPLLANISVTSNTQNSQLGIVLVGIAQPVNSTTISLASNPNPSDFGALVTLTATVSTGANTGTLTGTVTFTDTFNGVTTNLGPAIAVNGSGIATWQVNTLAVGVHVLSASYNGDDTHLASQTPATVTQTVYELSQTRVVTSGSPSLLGQPVTFTATVSSSGGGNVPLSGTVTFTDSAAVLANNTVNLNNGSAQYTANALVQGLNTITATFTPTANSQVQGSSGQVVQTVQAVASLALASGPSPSTFGTPVTLTVSVPTVGTVAATGKVTISIVPTAQPGNTITQTVTLAGNPAGGNISISTLPVGTYTITATYPGDSNYSQATSASVSQTVIAVQTTTALAANPNPAIAGKPVALTATVTASQGTVTPTGTVTFVDTFNGANTNLGIATLAANGTASINPSFAKGSHSIVATYSGNADDNTSNATLVLIVNPAITTTAVTADPNPATVKSPITFTATVTGNGVTPTGSVNFLVNGTVSLGTGSLNAGGTAQISNASLAAGTYQITAVYAGDANNAGSTSAAISLIVGTIPTVTDLTGASTTGATVQMVLVSTVQDKGAASVTPTGTVTFTNGNTTIGSATLNADGVASLTPDLASGSYNIVATYSGDALHGPSSSVAVPISSTGQSFSIGVTPASVTVVASQSATVTVSLSSISGFTDKISLGCVGLPAGVNCHFSNITVPLPSNGSGTAQLTIDTNDPLGGGTSAMSKHPGKPNTELAGLCLPFSLFLGVIVWKFRKRNARLLSMVLIFVLTGAAMLATGCGGSFTQSTAAPGTYVIQITGVGTQSNVTQYEPFTLIITK